MEPANQYAPDPSFMEGVGLGFLRRRNANRSSRVERWSAEQLEKINGAQRRAVRLAALTGATSGALLAATEIALRMLLLDDPEAEDWGEQLPFWISYMAVVVVVSGVEIAYLYLIVLRGVAKLGSVAGLAFSRGEREQVIAKGLTRAALDFPNPHAPIYGIDPYARVPRSRLLLYALLYRLKVGATSFILRIGVRRVVARAAVRFVVPLLAVPVFAIWNAVIVHWVMRSARIRAAGPVMVEELDAVLEARGEELGETCRQWIASGVEEAIVRSQDAHPSYVLLLTSLFDKLDISPDAPRKAWSEVREQLSSLTEEEHDVFILVLVTTVLIDGRLRRAETELLDEAYRACGRRLDRFALQGTYRQFLDGRGLGDMGARDGSDHP